MIDGQYWKDKWDLYYEDVKKCLDIEVDIHLSNGVKQLGWIPEFPDRPTQLTADGKLKGHYQLKVRKNGTDQIYDVPAETDWVHEFFKPEVIAAAQHSFFTYLQKVKI